MPADRDRVTVIENAIFAEYEKGLIEIDTLDGMRTLARAVAEADGGDVWRPAETAPRSGYFLVWSPDYPDMTMTFRGDLFHMAREPGTPKHLSANHYTLWRPQPLPSAG